MTGSRRGATPAQTGVSSQIRSSTTYRNLSNSGCSKWLNEYADHFYDERDIVRENRRLRAENAELRRLLSGEQIP
jgi:hypothetical protein